MKITYQTENDLTPEEFTAVLHASTLAERRPVDSPDRIQLMLQHANLILTARSEGRLVGVARSLSDFAFCTYLSDLAVDRDYQYKGIGKTLIRLTWEAAPHAKLILLSAPAATTYYPRIGMERHPFAFILDDGGKVR